MSPRLKWLHIPRSTKEAEAAYEGDAEFRRCVDYVAQDRGLQAEVVLSGADRLTYYFPAHLVGAA